MAVSYMTEDGYKKLHQEIEYLETVERPRISQQIAEARDKGDLSENAEYDAAKEAQGMMEMKISQLKELYVNARILDERKLQLMMLAPAAGTAAPVMMRESEEFDELADSLSSSGELSNEKRKDMLNEAYILKNQQTRVEEVDEVDDDEAASDDYAESPEDE